MSVKGKKHIYLIGNRGSGKTTIGKMLAKLLQMDFLDLDQYLVNKSGKDIAQIVGTQGWSAFRKMETICLKDATMKCRDGTVFGTGGGVILTEENCEFMAANGRIIWLDVPLQVIGERLALDPDGAMRPGLTNMDFQQELAHVYHERRPKYAKVCDFGVAGANRCDEVCREIMLKLGECQI